MSTGPGLHDLEIYRGDTFVLPLIITDDAEPPVGIDLTSAVVTAQVRQEQDSTTILVTFDVTITDAVNGELTLQIEPAVTSVLDFQRVPNVVWDMQIIDGGITRTYLKGNVTLDKDVTR